MTKTCTIHFSRYKKGCSRWLSCVLTVQTSVRDGCSNTLSFMKSRAIALRVLSVKMRCFFHNIKVVEKSGDHHLERSWDFPSAVKENISYKSTFSCSAGQSAANCQGCSRPTNSRASAEPMSQIQVILYT